MTIKLGNSLTTLINKGRKLASTTIEKLNCWSKSAISTRWKLKTLGLQWRGIAGAKSTKKQLKVWKKNMPNMLTSWSKSTRTRSTILEPRILRWTLILSGIRSSLTFITECFNLLEKGTMLIWILIVRKTELTLIRSILLNFCFTFAKDFKEITIGWLIN